ncbi:MAG: ribosomal-processing cysteine protease Prp [Clostridia bacterium]|nr:ribosomal-processing cysteine protease Prp [Clostridia bacterium]
MITVTVFRDGEAPVGVHVTGHAGCGAYGEDLVCAAVSAVVQTAILGITDVLNLNAGVSIEEGDTTCILDRDTSESELKQARIVFETMETGLRSIQASYPKTLKFRSKEV